MEQKTDSFDFLFNASSDPELWLLIAGPAALLALIIIGYLIAVFIKRKKEQAQLVADVEEAGIGADRSVETKEFSEDIPTEKLPVQTVMPADSSDIEEIRASDKKSWITRLRSGLSKTRDNLRNGIESIFTGKTTLSNEVLEQIHEVLYRAS